MLNPNVLPDRNDTRVFTGENVIMAQPDSNPEGLQIFGD